MTWWIDFRRLLRNEVISSTLLISTNLQHLLHLTSYRTFEIVTRNFPSRPKSKKWILHPTDCRYRSKAGGRSSSSSFPSTPLLNSYNNFSPLRLRCFLINKCASRWDGWLILSAIDYYSSFKVETNGETSIFIT